MIWRIANAVLGLFGFELVKRYRVHPRIPFVRNAGWRVDRREGKPAGHRRAA